MSAVVHLKTVAGRSCTVAPPVTLRRLLAAAAAQLQLQPESIKLCANGKLLYPSTGKNNKHKHKQEEEEEEKYEEDYDNEEEEEEEVEVPGNGVILVVGKPNYQKSNAVSMKCKAGTSRDVKSADRVIMEKRMSIDSTMKRRNTEPSSSAAVATKKIPERKRKNLTSTPTMNATRTRDDEYDQDNSTESDMYRILKHFVFLRGKHSLLHLLETTRKDYRSAPEFVRDHPLVVSIVEYVNRDPDRLKEVLITIQEEEPELLRWIKRNADFFLSVINAPPFWRDGTSPMWLIRYAKEIYHASSGSISSVADLSRHILETYHHDKIFIDMYSDILIRKAMGDDFFSSDDSERSNNESFSNQMESDKKKNTSKELLDELSYVDACLEDDSLLDPYCQEVESLYRTWEITRERWSLLKPENPEKSTISAKLQSLLCDGYGTLMRVMEYYLLRIPSPAVLAKLNDLAQKFWSEGEEWHIGQKNISDALDTALGHHLFNAGSDLIKVQMDACLKNQNKIVSKNRLSVVDGLEKSPMLDPTIRWITSSGPYILAHELQEYSIQQKVTIVIYSMISKTKASAYVISKGEVHIAPINMDILAADELKSLESLYTLLEGNKSQEEEEKEKEKEKEKKKNIKKRWNTLMCSLYQRYITPIEQLLPPAATQIHDALSKVSEVCFIHTWTPKHTPIPFPALQSGHPSLSCALKWAPFMAYRPWDLILSSEVPWSTYATKNPTITRISDTIVGEPSRNISEESTNATTNMVMYMNINDVGCNASGNDLSEENNSKVSQKVEPEELWRHVPWEKLLRKALGVVHTGIPTYAFLRGKLGKETSKTALLIHEVVRTPDGWRRCRTEEKDSNNDSSVYSSSRFISLLRGVPFNQSADLFVSHVLGRESGVGIHRAALIPIFGVSGKEPNETYNYFFNSLISSENMTAAKAYRLALLLSWNSEYKNEPWRPASVSLLNYGGPMQTLSYLHGIYWGKRHVETSQPKKTKESNSEETERGEKGQTKGNAGRAVRDVIFSKYIEQHSIDSIFGVMMQGLNENKPIDRVAVFDAMIDSLERNRGSINNIVREGINSREVSLGGGNSPPVARVVTPVKPAGTRTSFVTSVRNMVAASRNNNGVDTVKNTNIQRGDKAPQKERQPPGRN